MAQQDIFIEAYRRNVHTWLERFAALDALREQHDDLGYAEELELLVLNNAKFVQDIVTIGNEWLDGFETERKLKAEYVALSYAIAIDEDDFPAPGSDITAVQFHSGVDGMETLYVQFKNDGHAAKMRWLREVSMARLTSTRAAAIIASIDTMWTAFQAAGQVRADVYEVAKR